MAKVVGLVEGDFVVAGDHQAELGGDGGELGDGFVEAGEGAVLGEVAAVEDDVDGDGWRVEGRGGVFFVVVVAVVCVG